MKKRISFVLVCLSLLFLIACRAGKEPDTVTVTLDFGVMGRKETVAVTRGEPMSRPEDMSRVGYTPDGWYAGDVAWNFEEDVVNEDTTLKLAWIPQSFSVYLQYPDREDAEMVTFSYGQPYELPTPERKGATFLGWYAATERFPQTGVWNTTINTTLFAKFVTYEPGTVVTFGCYEQDGNEENGKEPIEWLVIDKQGDRAYLVSRAILDELPFHDSPDPAPWGERWLREWLNGTFLNESFTEQERDAILVTDLPEWNEKDTVFLLSYEESTELFLTAEDLFAQPTPYAKAKAREDNGMWYGIRIWDMWARDKVSGNQYVDYSLGKGINRSGHGARGVRPALWVDMKKLEDMGIEFEIRTEGR